MVKKEMIAMLLAGGQGSSLGILTESMAKCALPFGGKYRLIDFPLSNCTNSGIDTVGVLTGFEPLRLHTYVGIGIPWDLDRNEGGVTLLPPGDDGRSAGTANAVYRSMSYMESFHPDYVLILTGDHVYKMDYERMLDAHKASGADVTVAVVSPAKEETAGMGIWLFGWEPLRRALRALGEEPGFDFDQQVIPWCIREGMAVKTYEFNGYWRGVPTLGAYWEANLGLVDIIPEFNLYEEFWKVYTKNDVLPPQFFSADSRICRSLVGDGSEIWGSVDNSVIGNNVVIEAGASVRDSIVMSGTVIGKNAVLDKVIAAENVRIGEGAAVGTGELVPNREQPEIYAYGLTVLGEGTLIPPGVRIGRNTMVTGRTSGEDYPDGSLPGGVILRGRDRGTCTFSRHCDEAGRTGESR